MIVKRRFGIVGSLPSTLARLGSVYPLLYLSTVGLVVSLALVGLGYSNPLKGGGGLTASSLELVPVFESKKSIRLLGRGCDEIFFTGKSGVGVELLAKDLSINDLF